MIFNRVAKVRRKDARRASFQRGSVGSVGGSVGLSWKLRPTHPASEASVHSTTRQQLHAGLCLYTPPGGPEDHPGKRQEVPGRRQRRPHESPGRPQERVRKAPGRRAPGRLQEAPGEPQESPGRPPGGPNMNEEPLQTPCRSQTRHGFRVRPRRIDCSLSLSLSRLFRFSARFVCFLSLWTKNNYFSKSAVWAKPSIPTGCFNYSAAQKNSFSSGCWDFNICRTMFGFFGDGFRRIYEIILKCY